MGARILVAEDDDLTLELLATVLRAAGHEITAVRDGREALTQIEHAPFDLVVADVQMPRASGLEILDALAARTTPTPLVLVTAYADTALTVRALRQGAIGVLDKPFREDELWSFVQEALSKSDDEIRRQYHRRSLEERLKRLPQAERCVLQLLLDGCKNRTMAKRLDISLRTVENRRRRVFEIMETDSVAQLARMVVEYEHQLVPAPHRRDAWMALPLERVS